MTTLNNETTVNNGPAKGFHVFQIKYTYEEYVSGYSYAQEKADAHRLVSGFGDNFKADLCKYYGHVADVAATDVDDAFRIMNLWSEEDEAKVTRLAPLHSLSVGDVLVDPVSGSAYICLAAGWRKVPAAAHSFDYQGAAA